MTPYCEIDDSGFELDALKKPTRLYMLRIQQFSLYFCSNIYLFCSRNYLALPAKHDDTTKHGFEHMTTAIFSAYMLITKISLRNSTEIRCRNEGKEFECRSVIKLQVSRSQK